MKNHKKLSKPLNIYQQISQIPNPQDCPRWCSYKQSLKENPHQRLDVPNSRNIKMNIGKRKPEQSQKTKISQQMSQLMYTMFIIKSTPTAWFSKSRNI